MGRKVATLKRGRKRLAPVGDTADPDGLWAWLLRYLESLKVKGYTEQTLWGTERYLRDFIVWCDVRGLARPHEITKPIVEGYQRTLFYYRKANGEPLSFVSQRGKLTPVRMYFRWLTRHNHILYNPAADLDLPRMPRRLPKHVLTEREVEAVMRQIDTSELLGIRDRAVMEVLYSTGMRRMELANLKVPDIDLERGTVLIQQGKGRKDRIVPIGERAIDWIGKYLAQVRLHLVVGRDERVLFLTRTGEAFNLCWLSNTVARYVDAASIGKRGSCHLFRHTMATLMLENGADIRFIQAILGHEELSTTQIYTQVAIRVLKDVHAATHPSGKRRRPATPDDQPAEIGEAQQLASLLAALDGEAIEEADDAESGATWH